ncbi:MAG: hypothetical protein A2854_04330 [Parcubacteria group bacterium RIFCSPHIGHO2_01_FULL_56_18]|nr:MAG: hypothetical protein A2854_04330 [Parcubacteria group bacterium RIFCSPHIGHO2_01_FULL_56_18]
MFLLYGAGLVMVLLAGAIAGGKDPSLRDFLDRVPARWQVPLAIVLAVAGTMLVYILRRNGM